MIHAALMDRRRVLDALRELAGALPPAPAAAEPLRTIEKHREVALGVCVNELSSPSTALRHAVAAALRRLGSVELAAELEEIAEDPRVPEDNRSIARELHRELRPRTRRSSAAFPLPTADHPGPGRELLATLDEDPSARATFLSAWSTAPTETRVTALEGLAVLRDTRAIPLFEAAASDREARVAEAAIQGLVACPDPVAREVLEDLASGAHGPSVRRLAGRYLMGLKPDPPEARGKAAHCVAGPLDLRGERDLLLAAPRTGGARWDLLRARLGVRGGILSVEARPNISAAAANSAATRLANDGGYLASGPGYARTLLEDALAAPEAGPNRLGKWSCLLGPKPLTPRPYRPNEEYGPEDGRTSLRAAERLLRRPEFRGWFISDPLLDHLRDVVLSPERPREDEVMDGFLEEFLEPQRWVLLRSLELTRDLLLRRGDRALAKTVTAAEWTLRDYDREAARQDPFLLALVRQRLCAATFEPASGV